MKPSDIVRSLDEQKFLTIFKESPKQVRELIYDRLHIKMKPQALNKFSKPGEKNELRNKQVYQYFQQKSDNDIAEEILRNYFLKNRALLSAALDYLKIPHENGLTDSDLDAFEKISKEDALKFLNFLAQNHDPQDAKIYLQFLKTPLE